MIVASSARVPLAAAAGPHVPRAAGLQRLPVARRAARRPAHARLASAGAPESQDGHRSPALPRSPPRRARCHPRRPRAQPAPAAQPATPREPTRSSGRPQPCSYSVLASPSTPGAASAAALPPAPLRAARPGRPCASANASRLVTDRSEALAIPRRGRACRLIGDPWMPLAASASDRSAGTDGQPKDASTRSRWSRREPHAREEHVAGQGERLDGAQRVRATRMLTADAAARDDVTPQAGNAGRGVDHSLFEKGNERQHLDERAREHGLRQQIRSRLSITRPVDSSTTAQATRVASVSCARALRPAIAPDAASASSARTASARRRAIT